MRFPVGLGTQEDFAERWYIATPFGYPEPLYGFHEGEDINLKTGGDTDLGQPLYAVADGKIVFFHNSSHPTTGFGRHMVLECETSRGKRFYHYAHCQEITSEVKTVKQGDVIGKLGKSGTKYAHLHFSVFKVDPSTLVKGIDSIAVNTTNLNAWWEKFELLEPPVIVPVSPTPIVVVSDPLQPVLDYYKVKTSAELIGMVDQQLSYLKDERSKNKTLETVADQRKKEYESLIEELAKRLVLPSTSDKSDIIGAVERLLAVEDQVQGMEKRLKEEQEKHKAEVVALQKRVIDLTTVVQKQQAENERILVELEKLRSATQVVVKQTNFFTDFIKNIFGKT